LSRKLTRYERESIIKFNEGDDMASIFTYNRAWQKHLETRLGLKPTMDNGFGGRAYEIDKRRIRPPRAPLRLSVEARAKLAERLRQSHDLSSQISKPQAKSEAKKQNKGRPLTSS